MPHFYIRRVPSKLHLRWKRLAFALKADMREVVLDAIDAYVSAKEIELEKLLNPPAKTNNKKKLPKKVVRRKAARATDAAIKGAIEEARKDA